MRKGNLGIFLILSLIFLFGCGKIQSEDISSHTGISIARRGESLITAKPETAQLISQENTLSSENSLKASITISDESLEESPSNSSGGVESTPEPAPSSATLPPPTQVATDTIAVSLDVPDQREICAPNFDRSFESEVIELINNEGVIKKPNEPVSIDTDKTATIQLVPRVPVASVDLWCTNESVKADSNIEITIPPGETRFVALKTP